MSHYPVVASSWVTTCPITATVAVPIPDDTSSWTTQPSHPFCLWASMGNGSLRVYDGSSSTLLAEVISVSRVPDSVSVSALFLCTPYVAAGFSDGSVSLFDTRNLSHAASVPTSEPGAGPVSTLQGHCCSTGLPVMWACHTSGRVSYIDFQAARHRFIRLRGSGKKSKPSALPLCSTVKCISKETILCGGACGEIFMLSHLTPDVATAVPLPSSSDISPIRDFVHPSPEVLIAVSAAGSLRAFPLKASPSSITAEWGPFESLSGVCPSPGMTRICGVQCSFLLSSDLLLLVFSAGGYRVLTLPPDPLRTAPLEAATGVFASVLLPSLSWPVSVTPVPGSDVSLLVVLSSLTSSAVLCVDIRDKPTADALPAHMYPSCSTCTAHSPQPLLNPPSDPMNLAAATGPLGQRYLATIDKLRSAVSSLDAALSVAHSRIDQETMRSIAALHEAELERGRAQENQDRLADALARAAAAEEAAKDKIVFAEERVEAEKARADDSEARAALAEKRINDAEMRTASAESEAAEAKKDAEVAQKNASTSEQNAVSADKRASFAEKRADFLEESKKKCEKEYESLLHQMQLQADEFARRETELKTQLEEASKMSTPIATESASADNERAAKLESDLAAAIKANDTLSEDLAATKAESLKSAQALEDAEIRIAKLLQTAEEAHEARRAAAAAAAAAADETRLATFASTIRGHIDDLFAAVTSQLFGASANDSSDESSGDEARIQNMAPEMAMSAAFSSVDRLKKAGREMTAELNRLRDKCRDARDARDALRQEIATISSDADKHRRDLASAEEMVSELKAKREVDARALTAAEEALLASSETLNTATKDAQKALEERDEAFAERDALSSELSTVRSELHSAEAALESSQMELEKVRLDLASAARRDTDLEQSEDSQQKLAQLSDELSKKAAENAELSRLRESAAISHARAEQLDALVAEAQNDLSSCEKRAAETEQKLADAQVDLAVESSRVKALEHRVCTAEGNVQQVAEQLAEQLRHYTVLRREKETMREKAFEVLRMSEEQRAELRSLQAEMATQTGQAQALSLAVNELHSVVQETLSVAHAMRDDVPITPMSSLETVDEEKSDLEVISRVTLESLSEARGLLTALRQFRAASSESITLLRDAFAPSADEDDDTPPSDDPPLLIEARRVCATAAVFEMQLMTAEGDADVTASGMAKALARAGDRAAVAEKALEKARARAEEDKNAASTALAMSQKDLAAEQSDCEKLRSELSLCRSALEDAHTKVSAAEEERDAALVQKETLEREVKELCGATSETKSKFLEAESRAETAIEDLAVAQKALKALTDAADEKSSAAEKRALVAEEAAAILEGRAAEAELFAASREKAASDLEAEVAAVRAQASEIAKERDIALNEINSLKGASTAEVAEAKSALSTATSRCRDLQEEVTNLKMATEQLESDLGDARVSLESAMKKLGEKEAEIGDLMKQLEVASASLTSATATCADKEAALASEVAASKLALEAKDSEMLELKSSAEDLQTLFKANEVESAELKLQVSDFQTQMEELRSAISAKEAELAELKQQADEASTVATANETELNQQVSDLEVKEAELKKKVDLSSAALEAIKAEVAELTGKAIEAQAALDTANTEADELRKQLSVSESSLRARADECAKREDEVIALKDQVQSVLADSEEKLRLSELSSEDFKSRLEAAESVAVKHADEEAARIAEAEATRMDLEKDIASLKDEISRLTQSSEETQSALKAKIDELQKQLDDSSSRAAEAQSLESRILSAEAGRDAALAACEESEREVVRLRGCVEAAETMSAKSKSLLEASEEALRRAKDELAVLEGSLKDAEKRAEAEMARAIAAEERAEAAEKQASAADLQRDSLKAKLNAAEEHEERILSSLTDAEGRLKSALVADAASATALVASEALTASLRSEADTARGDAATARAEADLARAEADSMRFALDAVRADADTARADAETARAEADAARADTEVMKSALESAKLATSAAEASLVAAHAVVADSQHEAAQKLEEEVEARDEALARAKLAEEEANTLARELFDVQKRFAEAETALAAAQDALDAAADKEEPVVRKTTRRRRAIRPSVFAEQYVPPQDPVALYANLQRIIQELHSVGAEGAVVAIPPALTVRDGETGELVVNYRPCTAADGDDGDDEGSENTDANSSVSHASTKKLTSAPRRRNADVLLRTSLLGARTEGPSNGSLSKPPRDPARGPVLHPEMWGSRGPMVPSLISVPRRVRPRKHSGLDLGDHSVKLFVSDAAMSAPLYPQLQRLVVDAQQLARSVRAAQLKRLSEAFSVSLHSNVSSRVARHKAAELGEHVSKDDITIDDVAADPAVNGGGRGYLSVSVVPGLQRRAFTSKRAEQQAETARLREQAKAFAVAADEVLRLREVESEYAQLCVLFRSVLQVSQEVGGLRFANLVDEVKSPAERDAIVAEADAYVRKLQERRVERATQGSEEQTKEILSKMKLFDIERDHSSRLMIVRDGIPGGKKKK